MSDNWYYVQKGNRHGPVSQDVINSLILKNELHNEDYVWKKGFDNWKKIAEVNEFGKPAEPEIPVAPVPPKIAAPASAVEPRLRDFDSEERLLFIRIGNDRGQAPSDYGPFSLRHLKQLFKEHRINGKTFIFATSMKEWKVLGDFADYAEVFEEEPPVIKEADRRAAIRKPFIARMFFQNNKKLYEGVCRDISIGGMQVLTDSFRGKSGDKITINVHPENTDYHFTASGVVVRILEGNSGFSFRFDPLSDEAKRSIEKYVQEN